MPIRSIIFLLCFFAASVSTCWGEVPRNFLTKHCLDCHDKATKTAGLDLESLSPMPVEANAEVWETVVRRLATRQMPPGEMPRPSEPEYQRALAAIVAPLDAAYQKVPNPGRTETFRRLTRTEYQNAIRDLLAVEVDAKSLLPAEESSHGFDNITVGDLSPTLLNRYISAAQKISRLAVGGESNSPSGTTIRVRPDLTQEQHIPGLPLGTRGGALIPHTFAQTGEYEIQIRLTRDRNEEVEGLKQPHEMEVLLDRELVKSFTVKPPRGPDHANVDRHLIARFQAKAGPHDLGVTFLKKPASVLETKRQPFEAHFNMHRHPRLSPAVYQVSITGPFSVKGPGDTPSRERIFTSRPKNSQDEEPCAARILTKLMRRAYRRPITQEDLKQPLEFYRQARAEGDFEAGIESALSAVLVNPNFLFRVERDPADVPPGTVYQIYDLDLASRLSFFLWSSIPDEELLDLAEAGKLHQPEVLKQQARRMLKDSRSRSLVENFADQWLYLRNLDSFTPDQRWFPDFVDNLRQAFRQETELFFESILREDKSILELLRADYTFLNERLAKHYGIPHVYGSRFRRVELGNGGVRGGLLRQGSILSVTSYATRTSPVIRGHWVLKNILGSPPPPPPADVPALKDNTVAVNLTVRERLAEHRANPNCASCHNLMDPVGLSLENFDAVGRWRDIEAGKPIDAAGGLPDGSTFTGIAGLESALLNRPELFAGTLTEKLLTYALGRGVENADAPAIRQIVREAKANDYRLSALIVGICRSEPFRMRTSEAENPIPRERK
jgi:hypothetical protein